MKILLFDDNPFTTELMTPIINEALPGAGLDICNEFSQLLKLISPEPKEPYDLFICDWHLGVYDGMDLTGDKIIPLVPVLRVLIISGSTMLRGAREFALLNGYGFLPKPITNINHLVSKLREMTRGIA